MAHDARGEANADREDKAVRIIPLDAHGWRARSDFYDALLSALGAPERHGDSVDALIDSIIVGDMNDVEPPFRVEVNGLSKAASVAVDALTFALGFFSIRGC